MSSSAPAAGAAGAARGTDAPTAEQRHANVVAAILELCKTVADTAARAHAAKMAGRHGDDRLDNFTPEQEQRAREKHYQWMMDQLTHSGALFSEQNMSRATGSTRQELVTMSRTAIEGALQKNEASIVGKRREREEDLQACSVAPGKEALQQGAALQQGPPTMFAAMMSAPDGKITVEAETECLRAQVKDRIMHMGERMRSVRGHTENIHLDLQAMIFDVDAAQLNGLRYAFSTLKNADHRLDEANVSCGTARQVISMARDGMPYAFSGVKLASEDRAPAEREERAGANKQDTLYADGSELRRTPPLGDEGN